MSTIGHWLNMDWNWVVYVATPIAGIILGWRFVSNAMSELTEQRDRCMWLKNQSNQMSFWLRIGVPASLLTVVVTSDTFDHISPLTKSLFAFIFTFGPIVFFRAYRLHQVELRNQAKGQSQKLNWR